MNMMKIYNFITFILLLSLISITSFGGEFSIKTENNIIVKLRPGQKVTAGFTDITASEDVRIIKIEAKKIGLIEAHSMIMDGDVMKMRKISSELVKNEKYKFKPGGNHLMLFDVERDLKTGDDIKLKFTFQLQNKKILSESIQFKVK